MVIFYLIYVFFLHPAGVFHQAGIKDPYLLFLCRDSGLRPKEAPLNNAFGNGICIFPLPLFMGCNHSGFTVYFKWSGRV